MVTLNPCLLVFYEDHNEECPLKKISNFLIVVLSNFSFNIQQWMLMELMISNGISDK